eukprot:481082_1
MSDNNDNDKKFSYPNNNNYGDGLDDTNRIDENKDNEQSKQSAGWICHKCLHSNNRLLLSKNDYKCINCQAELMINKPITRRLSVSKLMLPDNNAKSLLPIGDNFSLNNEIDMKQKEKQQKSKNVSVADQQDEKKGNNTNAAKVSITIKKINIKYNNIGHKWKETHKPLCALKEFVRKKHKININESFQLEYVDNHYVIRNNNDLKTVMQLASQKAKPKLTLEVIITPVDLDIFDSKSDDCGKDFVCRCTRRIITAIKYYQMLDLGKSEDREKFIIFYEDIYKHMLDDFIHLITRHHDMLDKMYDFATKRMGLAKCNLKECFKQKRHNRDREDEMELKDENDIRFVYPRDMMDAIHCYVLHIYDFGLAVHESQLQAFKQEAETKTYDGDDLYRDDARAHLAQIVKQVKLQMQQFKRFKQNNKYQFHYNTMHETDCEFMEGMYYYVTKMYKLKLFLLREEYDSDAILDDIKEDTDVSNVFYGGLDENKRDYDHIKEYVRAWKLSGQVFATGFTYYYWNYYKDNNFDEDDFRNVNDRSGYQKRELFVQSKHKNLKEEMLKNKIRPLKNKSWMRSCTKLSKIKRTKHSKQLIAANRDNELHYDLNGTEISDKHLLAVILYCDWTDLCTAFSRTFRRSKSYKPLSEARSKNAEYANWSKLLHEVVQYFGKNGESNGDDDENKNEDNNKLKGPFYCGLNKEKIIPSFNIRLCSPTSTSVKIEVAQTFGGSKGIILQFNNNGDHMSKKLMAFDCSWLSTYHEEHEMLFIGGYTRMKLESIITLHPDNPQNFQSLTEALFYFDCMLNGTWMDEYFDPTSISNLHHTVLNEMIKKKLDDKYENKLPEYMNNVFWIFCYKKTQIVFNLDQIDRKLNALMDLIIEKIDANNFIPKKRLYNLFRNVNSFVLYTTNNNGAKEYRLPLQLLLKLIGSAEAPPNIRWEINANIKYDRNNQAQSWLKRKETGMTPEMTYKFKKNCWGCTMESQNAHDKLIIFRQQYFY